MARASMERASKARASKVRASKSGKGEGKQGEGGEQQQLPCSLHHHPNFYGFFLRAIAPFTGKSSHQRNSLVLCLIPKKSGRGEIDSKKINEHLRTWM